MDICPRCNAEINIEYRKCLSCSYELPNEIKEEPCKYPMVAWISKLTRGLSCITLVLGIALTVMGKGGETMMGITTVVSSIGIYISASVIQILIDIEKNTRKQP